MTEMAARVQQDSTVQKVVGAELSLEAEMGTLEIMRSRVRGDRDMTSA